MSNLSILIMFIFIDFFILLLSYKIFGKKGINTFIIISVIAANIQVNKGVEYEIMGLSIVTTLGNVVFGGIFIANDLINEKFGKLEARKAVVKSIYFGLSFTILMFISTLFNSIDDAFYKKVNNALDLFFAIDGRVLKAIIIGNFVYVISQLLDVVIYSKIKSYSSNIKWLWFRNTLSTLVSQIVDTLMIT